MAVRRLSKEYDQTQNKYVVKLTPIFSIEAYKLLRAKNEELIKQIRQCENKDEKRALKEQLVAFAYQTTGNEDGTLAGAKTYTNTVVVDIDHHPNVEELIKKILEKKDDLGLIMLEKSPSGDGVHVACLRDCELTHIQNIDRIENIIGVPVDRNATDIPRKLYATTDAPDELIYVNEELLFDNEEKQTIDDSKGALDEIFGEKQKTINYKITNNNTVDEVNDEPLPTEYDGVPFNLLVQKLEIKMGGAPAEGSRNRHYFSMCSHLRFICKSNKNLLLQILPDYGLDESERINTINSALGYNADETQVRKIVQEALDMAKADLAGNEEEDLPPLMPTDLPEAMDFILQGIPTDLKPVVASAVFPAFASHLKCRSTYIDNREKRLILMSCVIGEPSSGKSCKDEICDLIMSDIAIEDSINRANENGWKASNNKKGNKELRSTQTFPIRIVSADDINLSILATRMHDAAPNAIYTNYKELSSLTNINKNGSRTFSNLILASYDNSEYIMERKTVESIKTNVAYCFSAATTPTIAYQTLGGSNLTNGALSRFDLSMTQKKGRCKAPKYMNYDEEFKGKLAGYIAKLNAAGDKVDSEEAYTFFDEVLQIESINACDIIEDKYEQETYDELRKRALENSYRKAIILYILNDYKWDEKIENFCRWAYNYDMYVKMRFFGAQLCEHKEKAAMLMNNRVNKRGKKGLLESLPEVFTYSDLEALQRETGSKSSAKNQVQVWKTRKNIYEIEDGKFKKAV